MRWQTMKAACWAVLAAVALICAGAAAAAPPPVADFFDAPVMTRPVLSPNGQHLAVLLASAEGRRQLAVMDLAPPRQLRVVAGFNDADVRDVHWVNDNRLVFTIDDLQSAWADQWSPGLFAVDRRGEGEAASMRMLIARDRGFVQRGRADSPTLPAYFRFARVLRDGSDDVLVEVTRRSGSNNGVASSAFLRQNTRTGRTLPVDLGHPPVDANLIFDAQGRARLATTVSGNETRWYGRLTPDADWREVLKQPVFGGTAHMVQWVALGLDDRIYVTAPRPGDIDGTNALYRLDPATGQLESAPLLVLQGFDFQGAPIFDGSSRQFVGVRYLADSTGTAWLQPELQAAQTRLDQRLPGLVNLIDRAECGCSPWAVVTSFSDRQPPVHWLLDEKSGQLEPLGRARPRIDARQMAAREFTRLAARDGLGLPVYITHPPATPPQGTAGPSGPRPLVVLVHGGPFLRGGAWQWTAESQFLASRGYLVVEPEFRGSTGYGWKLFRAGWKQWGLKMQDDLADVVRWAVDRGLADPKRVCIVGGSYGGYAALMGLVRDPELYRCGVAYAAVTDIELMYQLTQSDLSSYSLAHGLPTLVGDRQADAEQLQATSPLQQAARIRAPLLLAFGGKDRRVPLEHGTRLREALAKTNDKLEYVVYPDEGHGFFKPANRHDFWGRVDRFLARELAAP